MEVRRISPFLPPGHISHTLCSGSTLPLSGYSPEPWGQKDSLCPTSLPFRYLPQHFLHLFLRPSRQLPRHRDTIPLPRGDIFLVWQPPPGSMRDWSWSRCPRIRQIPSWSVFRQIRPVSTWLFPFCPFAKSPIYISSRPIEFDMFPQIQRFICTCFRDRRWAWH